MPEHHLYEIRARGERGFWRAGRYFGRGWETYDKAGFSAAEWEVITKERQLEVRPLAAPAAPAAGAGAPVGGDKPPAPKPAGESAPAKPPEEGDDLKKTGKPKGQKKE